MSDLRQHKIRWRKLIGKNRFPDLFADMSERLDPNSAFFNQLIHNNSRYVATHQKEMGGLITSEAAELGYNQVRLALLTIIEALAPEDLGRGGTLVDALDEQLAQLKVKYPLTPLYLVNCDRQQNSRKFKKIFRGWEADRRHYQFYFALGCPSQEPEGFAERIVFEVMEMMADNHGDSIDYPRVAGSERLAIPPLPLGLTLRDAQEKFKKYLAERFDLGDQDFAYFLDHHLPARRESYLVFPFSIVAGDWEPDLMEEYLPWLMDNFSRPGGKGPTCLFIFVLWLKHAHAPERIRYEREVLESMQELIAEHEDRAGYLYPFKEVPRYYLEEWFQKVADVDQSEIDRILDLFCERLSEAELARYRTEDRLLDMERIEAIQERIWTLHRSR